MFERDRGQQFLVIQGQCNPYSLPETFHKLLITKVIKVIKRTLAHVVRVIMNK